MCDCVQMNNAERTLMWLASFRGVAVASNAAAPETYFPGVAAAVMR